MIQNTHQTTPLGRRAALMILVVAAFGLVAGAALAEDGHAHDMGKHEGHMAAPADAATVTVYVCESDPTVGSSTPGTCPLDSTALVEAQLDRSTVNDLANEKCPIMGGNAQEGVFALYKGDLVRFCCPGCAGAFFKDAAGHIAKLKAAK